MGDEGVRKIRIEEGRTDSEGTGGDGAGAAQAAPAVSVSCRGVSFCLRPGVFDVAIALRVHAAA